MIGFMEDLRTDPRKAADLLGFCDIERCVAIIFAARLIAVTAKRCENVIWVYWDRIEKLWQKFRCQNGPLIAIHAAFLYRPGCARTSVSAFLPPCSA